MKIVSISGIARWAAEVAALDAPGPFPTRTVLVPSEAHAHALRVELVAYAPHVLAGTRFFTTAAAARSVLDGAEIAFRIGEETRRPLRLRKLFRNCPALATYRAADLDTPGWEAAFAATIEQLEAAALRPEDLDRIGAARASDLATIWRAVDEDAGTSWTVPRLMSEACGVLAVRSGAWPFDAPVLAAVSIGIEAAQARLLHLIPKLTLGIAPGRPARRGAIDRLHGLVGEAAARIVASPPEAAPGRGELGVLVEYLFEPPARLVSADRRRSDGPDGTVALEVYAGVDEEIDAAARWVADEVFRHRTPLQDIAILVPTPDPLATMVAARLEALPWPGARSVHLACGRPATATAAGARLAAIVRILAGYLPADEMIQILPRLRLAGSDGHLSPANARALVRKLGTIGGSPARPEDATRWCERLARTEPDDPARAVLPAVEALVAVANQMIDAVSLDQLWRAIRAFVTTHVIAPQEMTAIIDQLDGDVRSLAADDVTAQVLGVEAVALIEATLRAMRLDAGRYGEPAIYIGTVTGAAGLPFSAVRVIGLAESAFPGTLRADAILPAELRRRLPDHAMISDDDFATMRLQAFDQVVRGVGRRLCVSAARIDVDGSEREPAALFIEMAAALARPNATTGERTRAIPTAAELERDAFCPVRAATQARRMQAPLTSSCWFDRVASGARQLPSTWSPSVVIEPRAVIARATTMHGDLGSSPLTLPTPGVDAAHPISASALRVLLACPQRFLLERILGFWPRADGVETHQIAPASYGTLFHSAAESFSRAHGVAFGARSRDLEHWLETSDRIACAAFDAFVGGYPLIGDTIVDAERRRLRRDIRTFIVDDWDAGRPRSFIAAERVFGDDSAVAIETDAGPLFVAGRIDRIDVEDGVTIVRDLKTGRARPRTRDQVAPDVTLDLQLGVYVAVTECRAAAWSLPAKVSAAYVYVDHLATERERSFREDRQALRTAGARWIALARSLIRDQSYVQTPASVDCRSCPFSAVCGDDAAATNMRLREATGALAEFRELKA